MCAFLQLTLCMTAHARMLWLQFYTCIRHVRTLIPCSMFILYNAAFLQRVENEQVPANILFDIIRYTALWKCNIHAKQPFLSEFCCWWHCES